jgi:hypothetical protein
MPKTTSKSKKHVSLFSVRNVSKIVSTLQILFFRLPFPIYKIFPFNVGSLLFCFALIMMMMSTENNCGMMMSTDEDTYFFHQSSLKILPESSSSKAGGTGERNNKFCLTKYLFHTSKGSLSCRKIVQHGADGFTSPPKEGVLRIFIALKRPSTLKGFEPTNLGSNSKHVNH